MTHKIPTRIPARIPARIPVADFKKLLERKDWKRDVWREDFEQEDENGKHTGTTTAWTVKSTLGGITITSNSSEPEGFVWEPLLIEGCTIVDDEDHDPLTPAEQQEQIEDQIPEIFLKP